MTGRVDTGDDLLTGGEPVRAKEATRTPSTDHFSAKNKSFDYGPDMNQNVSSIQGPIALPMS